MTLRTHILAHVPSIVWRRPRTFIGGVVVVVVAVIGTVLVFRNHATDAPADQSGTRIPTVTVAPVSSFSNDGRSASVLGEVRSRSQAELRSKKSGEITRVNVRAGQYVAAGTILAEIENASERAAVLGAQGTLAAAEASRAKALAGARTEDRVSAAVQTDSAAVALQSAESAAQNTYNQAYSTAEDAVFSKADEFFSNPYTVNPSFRVNSATYDERQAVARERVALGAMLHEWKNRVADTPPSADDLDQALVQAGQDLERIKNFLNRIASFVSKQEVNVDLSDTNKAAQEATVLLARTSIDTARSAVSGARTALAGARSSAEVTSISESKLAVGERPEDIAAVEALVTQARGALAGARAQLENSLIRTPIAGTVVTFNVNRGDFVGAQQVVAVVANPRALEVVSYVSPLVGTRLSVGAPVSVGDGGTGIITSVAPGLDPATKKIRVTVSVTDGALVNGSFVSLGFDATSSVSTVSRAAPSTGLMVPISAIKVLPSGLVLLTVNASSTLDAYPIQEGTIIGDAMLIKEGLSPELVVVTDVRGLSPGDRVMIDES